MRGVDEVMAFFGALFKAGITVDNVHFGELDDGTVIEKHLGHGKIGDEEFLFPTATSYGVRDGRLAEVQVHTGNQPAVENYMWRMFPLKNVPARLKGW